MEENIGITNRGSGLPIQIFNEKEFRLYPNNQYFTDGTTRMHIYVWRFHNGTIPKGYHIHHKDEDKWNNQIENLELVERHKHLSLHAKKRIKENPEQFKKFYEAGIEAAKFWHDTEYGKETHKRISKESKREKNDRFKYY